MLKTVALLLDEVRNRYQQLLLEDARAVAASRQLKLLDPQYADGSSWNQLECINDYLRQSTPPDGMLVLLAGEQHTGGWLERAISKNVATVFLNRVPSWLADIRKKTQSGLVTAVAPTQRAVGELQGAQALKLSPPGGFIVLITGAAKSATAVERQRGFMDAIRGQRTICALDGRWSMQEADNTITEWFKVGAERARAIDLIVCQNDPMALGARRALDRRVRVAGRHEAAKTPIIGCDGLNDEGKAWVKDGSLTATVVLPSTTPAALDLLSRYWSTGARMDEVHLDVESFPPLHRLHARS